jgi:hypothetical protein
MVMRQKFLCPEYRLRGLGLCISSILENPTFNIAKSYRAGGVAFRTTKRTMLKKTLFQICIKFPSVMSDDTV